jgi:hypothetical protein
MAKAKRRRYTQEELSLIDTMDNEGKSAKQIRTVIAKTRRGTTLTAIRSQITVARARRKNGGDEDLSAKLVRSFIFIENFVAYLITEHGELSLEDFAKVLNAPAVASVARSVTLAELIRIGSEK